MRAAERYFQKLLNDLSAPCRSFFTGMNFQDGQDIQDGTGNLALHPADPVDPFGCLPARKATV